MIDTSEYGNIQATLIHRITGEIGAGEAAAGVAVLVSMLNTAVQKHGAINLIINIKGGGFANLIAHKVWSQGLEPYRSLKDNINYCALIVDDSLNARAEKELMENEKLKFFFDLDEGDAWLRQSARLKE